MGFPNRISLKTILPLSQQELKSVKFFDAPDNFFFKENQIIPVSFDFSDYVFVDKLSDMTPNYFGRKRGYFFQQNAETRNDMPFDYIYDSPEDFGTIFFSVSHDFPDRELLKQIDKFSKSKLLAVMRQLRGESKNQKIEYKLKGYQSTTFFPVNNKGVTSKVPMPDPKSGAFSLLRSSQEGEFQVQQNIYFICGTTLSVQMIPEFFFSKNPEAIRRLS